ncbi:MAG: hypothetical protein D8M58_18815 [Calditrichaeota bacterium]|nr:MAG: hypothetical protein DWQ03_21495 [Calditrichota bacterium]MBL1207463.1 hypothetical protein [Calditrichota bacterium]NOG47295.1 hypothetical protein [Calditrichota bacterium]
MKIFLSQSVKIPIFAVLFFLLMQGFALAEKGVYNFGDTYKIYHNPADLALVEKLIKKTGERVKGIENFFGIKPKSEIHIYLTKSDAEFQSYSADGFPEWAQAIAFVNKKIIIIRVANADEINRLPQVFLHELVHIYLGIQYSNTNVPTWLHEGIAQWLSNENLTADEQVLIANALYSDRLKNLAALDSMFVFSSNQARLGYALARSAVDYFIREYDDRALLEILDLLEKRESLNGAFKKSTGRDFIDFEVGWYAFIDEQYKWMVLLNVPDLVWVLLVVLFLAAVIRMRIKNKKTVLSWPEENEEE